MTQPASRSVLVTDNVTIDSKLARRLGEEGHGLVKSITPRLYRAD
jgi:hypothetical protein